MKGIMQATTDARLGFDLFKETSEFIFNLAMMMNPLHVLLDASTQNENAWQKIMHEHKGSCLARAYHFASDWSGQEEVFSKKCGILAKSFFSSNTQKIRISFH